MAAIADINNIDAESFRGLFKTAGLVAQLIREQQQEFCRIFHC